METEVGEGKQYVEVTKQMGTLNNLKEAEVRAGKTNMTEVRRSYRWNMIGTALVGGDIRAGRRVEFHQQKAHLPTDGSHSI